MSKDATTLNELLRELRQDEKYRREERRIAPYYDLAREIIQRRLDNKLTQKELAKLAGTYQGRISKIESGEHNVRISTIIQIADALNSQLKIMLVGAESYNQSDEPYIQYKEPIKTFIRTLVYSNET